MTSPVVVRLDLSPAYARITPPDGEPYELGRSRVIVGAERIWVFVDGSAGPKLELDGRLETFDGRNTTGWQATTASGVVIYFKRSGACLCGSQLRSFRPFPEGIVQGPYATT